MNVFFWPTKAFDSPAPLEMTLLASDENVGKEAKGPPITDDLLTVSTRTDEVSHRLSPLDRRGPAKRSRVDLIKHLQIFLYQVSRHGKKMTLKHCGPHFHVKLVLVHMRIYNNQTKDGSVQLHLVPLKN